MWTTQTNEHGESLSDFERKALIERIARDLVTGRSDGTVAILLSGFRTSPSARNHSLRARTGDGLHFH